MNFQFYIQKVILSKLVREGIIIHKYHYIVMQYYLRVFLNIAFEILSERSICSKTSTRPSIFLPTIYILYILQFPNVP